MLLVDIDGAGLEQTRSLILARSDQVQIVLEVRDLAIDGIGRTLVDLHVNTFGRLDYLVNVAGRPGGFLKSTETNEELFDSVQQLNVRGTYFLQRAAITQMLNQDLIRGEYVHQDVPG
jgi:NAD(P)-dependent dehydrogenase (short-subunit alcohol dehydrogenase family)